MPQIQPPAAEPINERCDHCGQRIPLARKELLNKQMIMLLSRAASHVEAQYRAGHKDANNFMVREFSEPAEFKQFNWFSHLRLHGLIFKQLDTNGKEMRGRWGITRNGWAFLRGEKELPAYILVRNNKVQSRSDKLVNFSHVWRGEPYMQTSFEYFDINGEPVGIRPNYGGVENRQASLI